MFSGIDLTTGVSSSKSREDVQQSIIYEIDVDFMETLKIAVVDVFEKSVMFNKRDLINNGKRYDYEKNTRKRLNS